MTRVIYFFHSWPVGQSFSSRSTCCLLPRWTAWMSNKSSEPGTQGRNYPACAFNLAQALHIGNCKWPLSKWGSTGTGILYLVRTNPAKALPGIKSETCNNYSKLFFFKGRGKVKSVNLWTATHLNGISCNWNMQWICICPCCCEKKGGEGDIKQKKDIQGTFGINRTVLQTIYF